MRIIDTIPHEQGREVAASLRADLLAAYHEADDEKGKRDAATLIALLDEDAKPSADELESDDYSDFMYERDDLEPFAVDSSHPDYIDPEAL